MRGEPRTRRRLRRGRIDVGSTRESTAKAHIPGSPRRADSVEEVCDPIGAWRAVTRISCGSVVDVARGQAAFGLGTGISFASLQRFWAVAARRNSSRAPVGPRNRRRSSLRIRLRRANSLLAFLRSRRDRGDTLLRLSPRVTWPPCPNRIQLLLFVSQTRERSNGVQRRMIASNGRAMTLLASSVEWAIQFVADHSDGDLFHAWRRCLQLSSGKGNLPQRLRESRWGPLIRARLDVS